jgi:hypothetical protein
VSGGYQCTHGSVSDHSRRTRYEDSHDDPSLALTYLG